MDMMVLSAVLTNGPNKTSAGRKDILNAAADFDAILQESGKELEKDLNLMGQNLNAVLLQLLALINMGQLSKEKVNDTVSVNIDNLQGNRLLMQDSVHLFENGEVNRLWKEMVSGYFEKGEFNEKIAVKFMKALKSCIPEIAKVDVNSFLEQLKSLLNQKAEGLKTAYESKDSIVKDSIVQEKTAEVNQAGNYNSEPIEKTEKPKPDHEAGMLTQDIKQDIEIKGQEMEKEQNQLKELVSKTEKSYSEPVPGQKSFDNNSNINIPVVEKYTDRILPQSKTAGLNEKLNTPQETTQFSAKTLEQIVENIQLALKDGTSELSVKLKPEHLGNVMVRILSEGNKLRAELFIENAHIHEAVQYHAQELKNQMQQQGYNLTEVNIYQTSDWPAGNFYGREFERNYEFHRPRKMRYNFKDEEEVKAITSMKYFNGLENTVSVNCVV